MARHKITRESLLGYLERFEPARLRAGYVALVALLAAFGVTLGSDLDAKVGTILGVLGVLVPFIQGELTRRAVYAPGNVAVAVDELGKPIAGPASPVASEGDPVAVADPVTGDVVDAFGRSQITGTSDTYGTDPADVIASPVVGNVEPELTTPASLPLEEQDAAGT